MKRIFPHSWIHNDLEIALVGAPVDLTYEYEVSSVLEISNFFIIFFLQLSVFK